MTIEDAYSIFCRAKRLNLSGWELLTPANIEAHCNGIGADWMPRPVRIAVTHMNPTLRLAAAIHDIRYGIGGTEADRRAADLEFLRNGIKLATAEHPWYTPRRGLVYFQSLFFWAILRFFGGIAFS